MVGAGGPFGTVDRMSVIMTLRAAGSRDPDVLRARKELLVRAARWPQYLGFASMLLGVLLSIGRPGPVAGVPVAVIGWWLWRRGVRNVTAVESAYSEFVKSPSL